MVGHRVTLEGRHFDGMPHFFVARGCVGDPLTTVSHHVSSPYVKRGAIGGTGRAVVMSTLLVKLGGWRHRAALSVHDARVAGIAGDKVRVSREIRLLLLFLLLLFRFIFLAAIILCIKERLWLARG